jgi:tRNA pseudouridine13 synthase
MVMIKAIPEDFTVEELLPKGFIKKKSDYKVLLLTKRDANTEDKLQEIAHKLHIPRRMIGSCGNKDKNAVTRQYITIKNSLWKDKGIEGLTPAGYSDEPLALGKNTANAFTITVRDLDEAELDNVRHTSNIKRLTTNHFRHDTIPNYFDEQRFSKNNAEIGRSIIKKDFAGASSLIFGTPQENPIANLRTIPQKQLLMYVHAYQSLLWNKTAITFLSLKGLAASKGRMMPYSQGQLFFPDGKIADTKIPLIGFGTSIEGIKNARIKNIITGILSEENITPRDFIIRQMPEITSEGGMRPLLIAVTKLRMGKLLPDELHPGKKKQTLSFAIPKGSYATIVVKAFIGSVQTSPS